MTLDDFLKLHDGDCVKIVDTRVKGQLWNLEGEMDKYLGTTVTIKTIVPDYSSRIGPYALIYDDASRWWWFPGMIECVVNHGDFDVADDESFMRFIGG